MTSPRDDDALSWTGDDDPTLTHDAVPPQPEEPKAPEEPEPEVPGEPEEPELPEGWSAPAGRRGQDVPASDPDPVTAGVAAPHTSSAALLGTGVLAGVYLLYTIGWFIGVARVDNPIADPLGGFMFSLGTWLAVAAPAIWFGACFWLLPARPRARFLWLIGGAIALAPLPMILGAGVAA